MVQEVNVFPSSFSCLIIADFPILVIEIGKFALENTLNYKFNYLFNCRKIFDIMDAFRFLGLASACREFKV
jgi:hypothetical protein